MKQKFTLVLIIAAFCFFKFNTANAQVNKQDSLALVDLYNSTNGPGWSIKWNLTEPVSTWHGITLTNNRVVYIYLANNKLSGNLPASLSKLTNLTGLELSNNKITGTIPPSVGNLINLERILLSINMLSGTIPASFSKLKKLRVLLLVYNQLTGGISFLSKIDSIEYINLAGNQLSGKIPVINSPILGGLVLSSNQFTGSIPVFRKNTIPILYLNFSYNKLSGKINHQFDSLFNLSILYLNNNQLTGTVPSSLNNLHNLRVCLKTFQINSYGT